MVVSIEEKVKPNCTQSTEFYMAKVTIISSKRALKICLECNYRRIRSRTQR